MRHHPQDARANLFSNPFTTESTVTSDATPSAIPASDTPAMKEMNVLRLPPRRARV